MSEIPLSETPRIEKISQFVSDQINENLGRELKDSLETSPKIESTWTKSGEREIGWKIASNLVPNLTTHIKLKIKGFPFSEIIGLIKGVTIDNLLYLPSSVEYGTITEGTIPAGLIFHNLDYGRYNILILPNNEKSPPTPEINPFGELIRTEASGMFELKSKLIRHMQDLKPYESWEGVPGFSGRNKKYYFNSPRIFTAIPFGNRTILSVSSVLKMSYEQRFTIEDMGKKVKVKVVAPSMSDIHTHLSILSQLDYYVKHVGYAIETTGIFEITDILNSIEGVSLELPTKLMRGA